MRLVLFLLLLSLQTGCVANNGLGTEAKAEGNITKISKLRRGMTQAEVAKIMRQPYDCQAFVFGDDTYDLWFYVTSMTAMGQTRMMPANLTQIAFKNGILIGWGKGFLNYLKARKLEIEQENAAPPATAAPQSNELENKPLENILTPTTPPTSPHTTMSRPPDKKEQEPRKVPLTDDDEEMLRDEKQQDFDQT